MNGSTIKVGDRVRIHSPNHPGHGTIGTVDDIAVHRNNGQPVTSYEVAGMGPWGENALDVQYPHIVKNPLHPYRPGSFHQYEYQPVKGNDDGEIAFLRSDTEVRERGMSCWAIYGRRADGTVLWLADWGSRQCCEDLLTLMGVM